jgi:hypothetical protein
LHLTLIARNVRVYQGFNIAVLILQTVMRKKVYPTVVFRLCFILLQISFKMSKILLNEAQTGCNTDQSTGLVDGGEEASW